MNASECRLVYLYGLIPETEEREKPLRPFGGIDGEEAYLKRLGGITAVVCAADPAVFSEEPLEERLNDLAWLREKALHHHHTLMRLSEAYTVIPLKFCTLFQGEERLARVLEENRERILSLFEKLSGRVEWNIKVFCDETKLKAFVSSNDAAVEDNRKQIETLPPGRRFFERKRLDNVIRQHMDAEKIRRCGAIHEGLKAYSVDSTVKRNWDREMSGRKEEMNWNSVYLLDTGRLSSFLEKAEEYRQEHAVTGLSIEPSGPWPAYHFANLQAEEGGSDARTAAREVSK